VRQSLRFALPENQRQAVRLRLCGPGSRMPAFTQIVGDELDLKVDADERAASYDYRQPASPGGELADAIGERKLMGELALEPLAISRRQRMKTMRRWLWTGAAAAMAMIALDAIRFQSRVTQMRTQAAALQSQSEGLKALKATADRLLLATAAMNTLENTIRREAGSQVWMGAVLQELSRLTPPTIRLTNVSFKPGTGELTGVLTGYAMDAATPEGSATRTLESYMKELTASPLLDRLVLSNVQATITHEKSAQGFEVNFSAVASPLDAIANATSAAVPFEPAGSNVSAAASTGGDPP